MFISWIKVLLELGNIIAFSCFQTCILSDLDNCFGIIRQEYCKRIWIKKISVFLYSEINLVLSKKVQTELSNKKFGLLFPTYSNSLLYIKIDSTAFKILFGKTEPSDKSGHLPGRKFCSWPLVSAKQACIWSWLFKSHTI